MRRMCRARCRSLLSRLTSQLSALPSPMVAARRVSCYRAPDGAFVVLDGEVYDFGDDMPTEVPGTGAVNQAERIFQLYQQRGSAGLARVDAGATITIWNPDNRELRIFRDACGIVTAFYGTQNGDTVFASDMETLLAAGVPRRIDRQTIDYYLSKGYAPGPWCFIEGIRKIPPGHQLACQPGSTPNVTRYFRQVTKPKLSVSRKQRNERIGGLLAQALRRRCEPDRTTAVLVSGGIDSMLILSSLVRHVGARVEAYTFSYSDYSGPFNEADPARKLAAHLGVRHETVLYQPKDIADGLQQILRDYGEPLAWGLHSFMLRSMARREVGTIFTGVEPEWNLRKVDLAAIRYRQLPVAIAQCASREAGELRGVHCHNWRAERLRYCKRERNGLPPQFLRSSIMDEDLRRAIYVDPDWARNCAQASLELFLAALDELRDEDPYDQARLLDHRFLDADGVLFWNSVWARSYDLVVRHPYCDRDLRDFFLSTEGRHAGKIPFAGICGDVPAVRDRECTETSPYDPDRTLVSWASPRFPP